MNFDKLPFGANDIFDISQIEAGNLQLEKIGFSITELLQSATHALEHLAKEKGIKLHFAIDKAIYPVLRGDPYRLNQILLNLLSNAIKFTEKGSVALACKLSKESGHIQSLCITVTDTGIGMEDLPQRDESVSGNLDGQGLGMLIARRLVEMMEGSMSICTTNGIGTQISLHIPFEREEDQEA
jgi:signal transduction histidine kinase